ncbi:hypothetical protein [Bradyrhizobium sp. RD5-C2]|uniref:hypothetical protein n=1 Tax=Bradyrhizobium sp. RD5-C2 TaxID=244562 RepID=UPI001CC75729|nr:hypothetical protein [Bradyrhizobium sp. RD5-C2]
MQHDLLWGALMALCVALVPNLIVAVIGKLQKDIKAKLPPGEELKLLPGTIPWTIFFLACGASVAAPVMFGWNGPDAAHGASIRYWYPALLATAGIAGASYFIAVVGLNADGLGAGLSEIIDSTLSPCFYLGLAALLAGSRPASFWATVVAIPLAVCGLAIVGSAPALWPADHLPSKSTGLRPFDSPYALTLILCGVVGALGTAFSLWLVRTGTHQFGTSLGFAVMCRYGGVAFVCLLLAVRDTKTSWPPLPLDLCVVTFLGGAFFIGGGFFAAVHIQSEAATAASLILIPLVALAVEAMLPRLGLARKKLNYGSPLLWSGIFFVTVGAFLLHWADH